MRTEHKKIIDDAFEKMDTMFTTIVFNNECRDKGMASHALDNAYVKRFLNKNAQRIARSRWVKRNAVEAPKSDMPRQKHDYLIDAASGQFGYYESALNMMGNEFSSVDIAKVARELGADPYWTQQGAIGVWLETNPNVARVGKASWARIGQDKTQTVTKRCNESEAIDYLKSLGYRIMKPTTQWEEL